MVVILLNMLRIDDFLFIYYLSAFIFSYFLATNYIALACRCLLNFSLSPLLHCFIHCAFISLLPWHVLESWSQSLCAEHHLVVLPALFRFLSCGCHFACFWAFNWRHAFGSIVSAHIALCVQCDLALYLFGVFKHLLSWPLFSA